MPLLVLCALAARPARGDADAPRIRAALDAALTEAERAEVAFLEHLGWRFVADPAAAALTVHGGQPGRRESLDAARAAGDLVIRVPRSFDAAQARAAWPRLAGLADEPASRLAYRHRLAVATRRATARLARMTESGRFVFPELLGLVHSPTFVLRMPRTEWVERDRMFFAARSPSRALEEVYRLGATVECYVGQLMAIYSAQYELFGRAWFDEMFEPGEIVVGRPLDVITTPLLAALEYERPHEWRALLIDEAHQGLDPVLALAPYGPMAFVGLAGVVLNQDPEEFTNDNCIIVSLTQRALDEMVRGGGIAHLSREVARATVHGNRGKGLFTSRATCQEAEREVDAIMAQPAFSETMVYVHPDGVVPLGDIVKKKMEQSESPVTLRINLNGLDDALYQRFREAFRRGWTAQRAAAARAEAAAGD